MQNYSINSPIPKFDMDAVFFQITEGNSLVLCQRAITSFSQVQDMKRKQSYSHIISDVMHFLGSSASPARHYTSQKLFVNVKPFLLKTKLLEDR